MFGRDKLDLVFVSFLNIAIAGQNSVAPRQNFIKNEIQLVMFLSESSSVRVTLMTQISQCTIPHSLYPKCYKANTRSANTNRQFFPGNFYNFARVDQKNILPGTNFLHINSGA